MILLGVPLMTLEVLLGRIGRGNPALALQNVAPIIKRSRHWRILGSMSIAASYLILTYYLIIAGWILDYFVRCLLGQFHNTSHSSMITNFKALQANPWQIFVTGTFIVDATTVVIALGIKRGLE